MQFTPNSGILTWIIGSRAGFHTYLVRLLGNKRCRQHPDAVPELEVARAQQQDVAIQWEWIGTPRDSPPITVERGVILADSDVFRLEPGTLPEHSRFREQFRDL